MLIKKINIKVIPEASISIEDKELIFRKVATAIRNEFKIKTVRELMDPILPEIDFKMEMIE